MKTGAPCVPFTSTGRVSVAYHNCKVDRRAPGSSTQSSATPTSTSSSAATATDKDKPDWTGDSILSQVVNAAINFPPLFSVMKIGARSAIKGTAAKRGVPWDATVAYFEQSDVFQIKDEIEDKSMVYPSYYTQPFHGYDRGNLNWQAAFEVEPATEAMALRVWKEETELTPQQAQRRLRGGIFDAVRAFIAQHGLKEPQQILDVGCSTGVSTRWLADEFSTAEVSALDLSPYFLAVAELRERQYEQRIADGAAQPTRKRITYMHRNMESTGLPPASYDMVVVQFVAHECPARVLENMVAECRRLVRRGGLVVLVDNNPRSKVIQGLPPVLFTLMKSTEPWSDEYYAFDLEEEMRKDGLKGVVTVESDPRHRTVLGYA